MAKSPKKSDLKKSGKSDGVTELSVSKKGKSAVAKVEVSERDLLLAKSTALLSTFMDESIGKIKKSMGLSGTAFDPDEPRQHTGLTSLDILIGGGIVSGGWYTIYGGEQSAKTTIAMNIMASLIWQGFDGKASYWDYEGCLVGDTRLVTPDGSVTLREIADKYGAIEEGEYDTPGLQLSSVGQMGNNQKIFVKKNKPITRIDTESTHLRGYQHPILVKNTLDQLEWRKLEDLNVGDFIVVDMHSSELCSD